jgi:hypothetical protein
VRRLNCSTGKIFYTLREAQIVIESWRPHYNVVRPHAAAGLSPVAEAADPIRIGLSMAQTGPLAANGKSALLAIDI